MKRFGQGILLLAVLVTILTGCAGNKRPEDEITKLTELHKEAVEVFLNADYENAANLFLNITKSCGDNHDEWYTDAQVYYARCLQLTNQYEEAVKAYEQAAKSAKDDLLAQIYFYEGCCYIAQGANFENAAAAAFEKSLKVNSDDYAMNCRMCEAFMEIGLTDRAESYLKRIISDENSSDFLIGKTYYYLEHYDDAVPFLLRAVDDGVPEAYYYLGVAYEQQGEATKADEFYLGYLAKNPKDAIMVNQYGAFLMSRNDFKGALERIEAGLQLEEITKAEQSLRYNQAVCYEYLGDYAKAKELFQDYVKAYPLDTAALKEYKFLQSR